MLGPEHVPPKDSLEFLQSHERFKIMYVKHCIVYLCAPLLHTKGNLIFLWRPHIKQHLFRGSRQFVKYKANVI